VSRKKAIRLKAVRKNEEKNKQELGTPPERTLPIRSGRRSIQAGRNQELLLPLIPFSALTLQRINASTFLNGARFQKCVTVFPNHELFSSASTYQRFCASMLCRCAVLLFYRINALTRNPAPPEGGSGGQ